MCFFVVYKKAEKRDKEIIGGWEWLSTFSFLLDFKSPAPSSYLSHAWSWVLLLLMSVYNQTRQPTWIWCNFNETTAVVELMESSEKRKQLVQASSWPAAGVMEQGRPSSIQEDEQWGEYCPALQGRPLTCDASAVLGHNFFLVLKQTACCTEWTLMFQPGGCFGGAISSSYMIPPCWDGAQGSLRPGRGADSQAWHGPCLGLPSKADTGASHLNKGLGLLWEGLGCLTPPWSHGTF